MDDFELFRARSMHGDVLGTGQSPVERFSYRRLEQQRGRKYKLASRFPRTSSGVVAGNGLDTEDCRRQGSKFRGACDQVRAMPKVVRCSEAWVDFSANELPVKNADRDQKPESWQRPRSAWMPQSKSTPVAGSKTPVEGSKTPIAGSKTPDAGCQIPVAGFNTHVAGSKTPVEGSKTPIGGSKTPVAGSMTPVAGFSFQNPPSEGLRLPWQGPRPPWSGSASQTKPPPRSSTSTGCAVLSRPPDVSSTGATTSACGRESTLPMLTGWNAFGDPLRRFRRRIPARLPPRLRRILQRRVRNRRLSIIQ